MPLLSLVHPPHTLSVLHSFPLLLVPHLLSGLPPTYNVSQQNLSPTTSQLALPLQALKSCTPLRSTRLPQKLSPSDKPWLSTPDSGARLSWWITFSCMILGLIGAGALCYLGTTEALKLLPSQLCLVMDDSFSGTGNGPQGLDDINWTTRGLPQRVRKR
ncbi:hypothetical protein D9756_009182 [Leucocoprinus leucothites]|uniref:Uncharacterized protein n=1 Tax=Leucocoprinus leucothites TaxID=201217 RepID=A0A8H5FUX4_9AGAR|nr:hypothetical protein D9756_009182 [Leucoagaricus leucothites]